MTTTTATNFRANVERYLDLVINDSQEVIISRGNDFAVLIPIDGNVVTVFVLAMRLHLDRF